MGMWSTIKGWFAGKPAAPPPWEYVSHVYRGAVHGWHCYEVSFRRGDEVSVRVWRKLAKRGEPPEDWKLLPIFERMAGNLNAEQSGPAKA